MNNKSHSKELVIEAMNEIKIKISSRMRVEWETELIT